MKVTLILSAFVTVIMAQSVDTVSATASGVCEPHNDHWHCPAGVPEPTTPPALASKTGSAASAMTSSHSHDDENDHDHDHAATASTCEPHGDHWHCPSGVAQPSTLPAAAAAASATATTTRGTGASVASAAASAATATGAGVKARSGALGIVGAVGAWLL